MEQNCLLLRTMNDNTVDKNDDNDAAANVENGFFRAFLVFSSVCLTCVA